MMDSLQKNKASFLLILLAFWAALNLASAIFSGLVFKPFGSIDKCLEHSLFLTKLFIGAGLFCFTSEKYEISPKYLTLMLLKTPRRSVLTAARYFMIYAGMFLLILCAAICAFVILDNILPTPGGNSHLLGYGNDYLRFKALTSTAPGGVVLFLVGTLVLAPVIEELFYRRLFFVELRKWFSFPVSMLASSFLFGIFHSNILISGIAGAYLAYVYEKENNLSVNILLHSFLNASDLLIMAGIYRLHLQ